MAPTEKLRFGLRSQLVALFTIAFTLVFAAVFYWVYRSTRVAASS